MSGRIPQRFIDDLLDRIDIVDVVGARLDLRKSGKNHSARCPFHDEKTPSFSVSPDKQFYYCFGCGAGGNALGFVMDYDRIDFPRAVETLASLVGMEVPTEGSRDEERTNKRKKLYAALEIADRFYRSQLREESAGEAIEYLRRRGLSGEVARDFGIGFAPPGWDKLLALAHDDDDQIEQFADAGLLVVREEEGKIYDRFRHRIMFPIRDNRGRTIAFGGRVLGDDKPKYLNSPETPVFNKGRELYGLYEASRAAKNMDKLLVVEGYMDVVALAQFGITNAVATLGTATSVEHLEKIYRYSSEVVFCFDGDNAGRKAAQRAMETSLPTLKDGRSARFLFLPEGEDPDTLVREIGTDAFNKLLTEASPISAFLFETLSTGLDLELPDDRAKLSQMAAPLINRLPKGVFHQLMIDQLAEKTGLASATLEKLIIEENSDPPPWSTAPPGAYELPHQEAYDESYQEHGQGSYHDSRPSDKRPPNQSSRNQSSPNQRPPNQRPILSAQTSNKVRLSPAHWLIALLAHNPALAATIDNEHLAQLNDLDLPGMEILLPLINLLKEHPDYSLNHLLGYWRGIHGQEQGDRLGKIVNSDLITAPGHTDESNRTQVSDIVLNLLRSAETSQPVEQQIERLASKVPLNNEDRKTAVALWHKLSEENAAPELILATKQLLNHAPMAKK
jgi:DNA primase